MSCPDHYKTLVAVACELLSEGLVEPWPATLVALSTSAKDHRNHLPLEALKELIRHFFARPQLLPFQKGAAVLVRLEAWRKPGVRERVADVLALHPIPYTLYLVPYTLHFFTFHRVPCEE